MRWRGREQDFLRKEQQALGGEADFFGGDQPAAGVSESGSPHVSRRNPAPVLSPLGTSSRAALAPGSSRTPGRLCGRQPVRCWLDRRPCPGDAGPGRWRGAPTLFLLARGVTTGLTQRWLSAGARRMRPLTGQTPFYVSAQTAYEDPYKALAQEAVTASPIAYVCAPREIFPRAALSRVSLTMWVGRGTPETLLVCPAPAMPAASGARSATSSWTPRTRRPRRRTRPWSATPSRRWTSSTRSTRSRRKPS